MHSSSLLFSSLLFSSLLFSSFFLKAQPNQFHIEVCRVMSGSPAGPDVNCLGPGCFRYYYDVYIVPNNSTSNNDFVASSLDISAQLTVNGTVLANNPVPDLLSRFNIGATSGCFSDLPGTEDSVQPTEEEVSYGALPLPNHPTFTITFPNGQPVLLFTAVVDAFPGDTIDVIVDAIYTSSQGMATTLGPMTVHHACDGIFTPATVIFTAPSGCANPDLCIELGPHSGGGEEPAIIPVWLKGVGSDYEEIDVLINVTFDTLMEMPKIIGNDIPASDVEVFMNQSGGYSIYAHARNVVHTGLLFEIELTGPAFLSSGGTAILSVANGRYKPTGGNCCSPCPGADETVVFTGFPDCTEDISIDINGFIENNSQGCADMYVLVTVDWSGPPVSRDLYKLNLVLDLDLQGDISITGIENNYIGCPDSSSSYYCGGDTCFVLLDSNTIRYCFWTLSDPQTVVAETGFRIALDAAGGCVDGITVREAYLSEINGGPNVACVPDISIDQTDFPLCSPLISGFISNETGVEMKGYDISVSGASCSYSQAGICSGNYAQCVCNPSEAYSIVPSKDGDDSNGVTTYDIVLLSKHILNTQLLNSPYKMIAADVNKSNTITTFDMVQIRKLILHVNESFPNNTSWRFIPKSYVFPNPANPFEEPFPEQVNLNYNSLPARDIDFIALKVGDLNLSANYNGSCFAPSGETEQRAMPTIQVESELPVSVTAGDVFIIPFRHTNDEPLSAFQMGIGFDEEALSFIGAAKGDLERLYENSFGLTETDQGRIRMLWFTTDEIRWLAKKGQNLFYLSFVAERDISDMSTVLWLDDGILPNRGYNTGGNESTLALGLLYREEKEEKYEPVSARFYPNPFSGPPTIIVSSDEAMAATLWLFDAFGVRVAYRKVELQKGTNTFILDEASGLPAGIYRWKVRMPRARVSGLAVKQ